MKPSICGIKQVLDDHVTNHYRLDFRVEYQCVKT